MGVGGGGGGLLLMPEHSAARLNRVNCSGGQGVQHSSGTLCLHCVAERRGAGAEGWGWGCEGDDAKGRKSSPGDTPCREGVCV